MFLTCDHWSMFEEDGSHESFEDTVRLIVREVSGSIERIAQADLDDIAKAIGVDLIRARGLADSAVGWLRAQAEGLGDDGAFWGGGSQVAPVEYEPAASAGPHPLDLPTAAQGAALAAVDSGRRSVQPGRDALHADGEAPGASDVPGLIDELRARDWITADGQITLSGRHALSRWLDAAV
jgi:hypothetical protein